MADSQRDPPNPEKKMPDSPDKQPPTDPASVKSPEKHVTFAEKEAEGSPIKMPRLDKNAPIKSALKKSRSSSESSCTPPPTPTRSFGDQIFGFPTIDSEEVEQPVEQEMSEELPESPTNHQPKNEKLQSRSQKRGSSHDDNLSPEESTSSDLRVLEYLELSDQSSLDVTEDLESEADPAMKPETASIHSPEGTQAPQVSPPPTTAPEDDQKSAKPVTGIAPLASPDRSWSVEGVPDQSTERPASSSSSGADDLLPATGGYRQGHLKPLSPIVEEKKRKVHEKRKRTYSSDDKASATTSSAKSKPVLKGVSKYIRDIKDKFSPPRTTKSIQTDDPAAPETDEDRRNILHPSKILKTLKGPKTMESSAQTMDKVDLEEKDKDKKDSNEDQGDPAPSKLETKRKPGDDDEGSHGSAALMA